MTVNILIAICSSHIHAIRRAAVRDTWLCRLPAGMQARFFVGNGSQLSEADVVDTTVDDSYAALPAKVQAFFSHALERYDFDYLFKCDEDTYLLPERLRELVAPDCDLLGSQDGAHHNYAYGGAGYLPPGHRREIIRLNPSASAWLGAMEPTSESTTQSVLCCSSSPLTTGLNFFLIFCAIIPRWG